MLTLENTLLEEYTTLELLLSDIILELERYGTLGKENNGQYLTMDTIRKVLENSISITKEALIQKALEQDKEEHYE